MPAKLRWNSSANESRENLMHPAQARQEYVNDLRLESYQFGHNLCFTYRG
jgi:hypothetical protein